MRFLPNSLQSFIKRFNVCAILLCIACLGVVLSGCGFANSQHVTGATPEKPVQEKIIPLNKPLLSLVAFGDSGAGTSWQYTLAKQMLELHKQKPYPYVLLLGDIFYPTGADYVTLGEANYVKPYSPLWERGVRFLPVLGNHDVLKPQFVPGLMKFVKMPGRYYKESHGDVDLFALDTNNLDQEQLDWLNQGLTQSKASWKIVFGHHPPFTSGLHGVSDGMVKITRQRLVPILEKHRVDLYLAGHEHEYERFSPIHGVNYVVSGGGGAYLRNFAKPVPNSIKRLKVHHFLSLTVFPNRIEMKTIGLEGQVLDQATFQHNTGTVKPSENKQKKAA